MNLVVLLKLLAQTMFFGT